MEAWVWITLGAATAQTLRFMLQKHLSTGTLSAAGATFARFVYSAPLVAGLVLAYAWQSDQGIPAIPPDFWPYAIMGGLSQILATICTVALFQHRAFAVGITLKKTEVLLSVMAGVLILGDLVTWPAFLAICVGLVGVLLLSDPPDGGAGPIWRRVMNRATGLGLMSGVFFALSGVGYRGASLSLPDGDTFLRASTTLMSVTAFQTLALGAWLSWREPGELGRVFVAWRVAGLVGLTSMIGSLCWFSAFTLQTVGYVNAVGQSELILSLLASWLVFRERMAARELMGVAVLTGSIVALVLVV